MESNKTKVLSNRIFQHVNFIGTKITWSFNVEGDKVNIKAGWLGINTVNSTVDVEYISENKFIGKGFIKQKFSLEGNNIKTGSTYLKEIIEK